MTVSLPLKEQIVFGLSLVLSPWHQGSITVEEDRGMLESTNQAATQEALTQEGSMILLSDKWGIQLEDICEASENSKEEKKNSRERQMKKDMK